MFKVTSAGWFLAICQGISPKAVPFKIFSCHLGGGDRKKKEAGRLGYQRPKGKLGGNHLLIGCSPARGTEESPVNEVIGEPLVGRRPAGSLEAKGWLISA